MSKKEIQENTISDFISLLKPGVMMLIVFTAFSGIILAYTNYQPQNLHPFLIFIIIFSIALASGGSAAINMWYDSDIDRIMKRTQKRAIPSGKIERDDALFLGIFLAVFATILIFAASNLIAGFSLIAAILFYVLIYTCWLKRRTPQNIVIGGAAGSFPPFIGYVSISNNFDIEAIILFLIIFLWTPPHFWALSLYRNSDYKLAKVPMLPVKKGIKHTVNNIVFYSFLLVISSFAILINERINIIYLIIAIPANLIFLYYAFKLKKNTNDKNSIDLFKYSILYLFLIFLGIIIDALF
jgi:heme o synthase